MPTIHNEDGFRFHFYSDDHDPAHLHVEKGDAKAKIYIETGAIGYNNGFKAKELKKAIQIIENNKKTFLLTFQKFIKL